MNLNLFNIMRGVGAVASGGGGASGLLLSFDNSTSGNSDYITTSFADLYAGGFVLNPGTYGVSSLTYAGRTRIAKGSQQGRIFTTGADSGASGNYRYGEFTIPTLVTGTDTTLFNVGANTQPFRSISADFTVPHANPVITGFYYNSATDDLLIGATNYYGTTAGTTDYNMMRVAGASDLSTASHYGMFQMAGQELSGGYGCAIPAEYQTDLGGTHIFGGLCGGQIVTRLNNGVAAFVADISDLTSATATTDTPATTPAMHFPYGNDSMMSATPGLWNDGIAKMGNAWVNGEADYTSDPSRSATNYTDHSDVWNHLSWVAAAFFIPGTRTLMAIGVTGGLVSNIRYGDYDDTATYRGSYFPYTSTDYANYYWLFDVDDPIAAIADPVTNPPERIRPYQYGVISGLPILAYNREIVGAYYDEVTKQIVYAIQRGGTTKNGVSSPAFGVLDLSGVLPA